MTEPLELVTLGELLAVIEPMSVGSPLESSATLQKSIGGAEVNVAVSLARLGHRIGWVGVVGDDPFGRDGIRMLRGEGVDVSRVVVDGSSATGVYFKEVLPLEGLRNYPYRDTSAASRTTYDDVDVRYLLSARVLHLTGITALISDPGHDVVTRLMKDAQARGVHVSFDVNIRRRLLKDKDAAGVLTPFVREADTVFMSSSEAVALFTNHVPAALQALLPNMRATTIVVHDSRGAVAITAEEVASVTARAVPVVDPTGAGDGFVAGYLSGWLEGLSLTCCLERAEHCAAHVVTSRGDNAVGLERPRARRPAEADMDDR